jgi:MFS family permease
MTNSASQGRIDRRVFVAAGLLTIMFASLQVLTTTLNDLVRERFGLSIESTSVFFQVGTLASILMGLLVGLLSDRLGRRVPLIVAALALGGVTTAALPFMPTYNSLLVMRFVDSALGTVAITLLMTRGVDLSTVETRSRSMGVIMMGVPLGYLLGPLLAVWLGDYHLGWLFGVLGALQLAGAGYLAMEWSQREEIIRLAPRWSELVVIVQNLPRTWMPMLFGMVDKFSFAAIALLTSIVLGEKAMGGLGVKGIAVVLAIYNVAFIVANPLAGRLVAVWGSRPTVIVASILYGVVLILLGSADSVTSFTVLMGLAGALTSFQFVPNMTLVGDLSGGAHRATVMSVFNMMGSLAMLAGFAILGRLSAKSHAAAYQLTGWMEIVCGVIGLVALLAFALRGRQRAVPLGTSGSGPVPAGRVS